MPTKFNPTADYYRRPSLTGYNKLWVSPENIDFERNLRAEVHDPLWFLARQWQMGEFKGEDAGAPAFVRVETSIVQPQNVVLGNITESYDAKQMPLEVIVEREKSSATAHTRVQAGFYFSKLLKNASLDKFLTTFIENYPLPQTDVSEWDTEANQLLASTRGTLPDGVLIVQDLNNQNRLENWLRSKPNMTPSVTALLTAAKDLSLWLNRTYPQLTNNMQDARPNAWQTEQLEYDFDFEMTDNATGKKVQLSSDNYADGQLDWQDFTWKGDANLPNAVKKTENFIPSPVRYQGMPQPRYWEMEEGRINFGKISMSPNNVLSLAFAEFGLTYSNDWFWIPMPLKINTLCRVNSLTVTNVFGDIMNYTIQADGLNDPLSIFSLYQLYNPENNTVQPILYLSPTLNKIQEASPLERLYFMRDEISNLCWAIESIVPSATQTGKDMQITSIENEKPKEEILTYHLGTVPPESWTPFIPVKKDGKKLYLQRAKMPNSQPPKGQILQDIELYKKPYLIREEEVGRLGTIIERSWQRARWLNGKTFTWIGRRKTAGSIETPNGLRWDFV